MNKTLVTLLILFNFCLSYSQRIELLKEENGFREFKLDTKITDYDNIVQTYDEDLELTYYVVADKVFVFKQQAYDIRLFVNKNDCLRSIEIILIDQPNQMYPFIKEELERKYGYSEKLLITLGNTETRYWEYEYFRLHLYYQKDEYVIIRYSKSRTYAGEY